jgi:hypothetical protein
MTTKPRMTPFLNAYITAALWSSMDNINPETGGDPLDRNYDETDIYSGTLSQMAADCRDFQRANAELLAQAGDDEQNGHDFWLTRNHHGVGFWDRGYPEEIGRALTDAAHDYGSACLYVWRGRVYQHGTEKPRRKAT